MQTMNTVMAAVDDYVDVVLNTTLSSVAENLSEHDQLVSALGPRYRGAAETAVLTTVYSLIFISGIIGNVATCVVVYSDQKMHTATNFYLLSLALSDMLSLIFGKCMYMHAVWRYQAYCRISLVSTICHALSGYIGHAVTHLRYAPAQFESTS